MRSILLIICVLFIHNNISAQSLKFSTQKWDFGSIKEDGGEVSYSFEFTNTSNSPVVITNVTTTCGCTTPTYSKRPISPGESSTLEVEYDPMFRPGAFSREVTIHNSSDKEPTTITVTGDVTPRPKSVSEQYPYILGGGVRINTLYTYLQNISHDTPKQTQWEIINTSEERRQIELRATPESKFLNLSYPTTLEPGERSVVDVTYDIPSKSGFYGDINESIDTYIDGVKSKMIIQIRAYVVENFSILEKKGDASGRFSEKFINFGAISSKSTNLTRSFSIENLGTERLYIREVCVPQGVRVTTKGAEIKGVGVDPAEILEVRVSLDKEGIELGSMVKYVTFILNDPEQPVVRVKIVGEVSN